MRRPNSELKYLSMAFIACGLVLAATGMGAFSTATTEQEASVDVAEESAFLEFESADPTVSRTGVDHSVGQLPVIGQNVVGNVDNGSQVPLGTLTNHFSDSLTSIEITVSEDGSEGVSADGSADITVRNPTVADDSISSGASSQLTATVDCATTTETTGTVNLSIEATGSSTSVSTTQQVEITCAGGPSQVGTANQTPQPLQP